MTETQDIILELLATYDECDLANICLEVWLQVSCADSHNFEQLATDTLG